MWKVFFIVLIILVSNLYAGEYERREEQFRSVGTCFRGVFFDGDWMAVGTSYRDLLLVNFLTGETKQITSPILVNDFFISQNKLFILTDQQLKIFDLENMVLELPIDLKIEKRAVSLFIKKDKVFISNYRAGTSVYSLKSRAKITSFNFQGNAESTFIYNNTGYIYASAAGISGGQILSAVHRFNPNTYKIEHTVLIGGAPGRGLFVDNENVFLGEHFYWQVKKSKIDKRKYIFRYKSVFIPKPNAKGRAFRDEKNLYYCDESFSRPHIRLRSKIER